MRWFPGVLLIIWAVVFVACDPGIDIHFVNNTPTRLCWYSSHVGDADWCAEIKPHEEITYGTICTSDDEKLVVLTVGVSGKQIYERTATCREWEDSGARIVIDQVDGRFVVESSLPEITPTPAAP